MEGIYDNMLIMVSSGSWGYRGTKMNRDLKAKPCVILPNRPVFYSHDHPRKWVLLSSYDRGGNS